MSGSVQSGARTTSRTVSPGGTYLPLVALEVRAHARGRRQPARPWARPGQRRLARRPRRHRPPSGRDAPRPNGCLRRGAGGGRRTRPETVFRSARPITTNCSCMRRRSSASACARVSRRASRGTSSGRERASHVAVLWARARTRSRPRSRPRGRRASRSRSSAAPCQRTPRADRGVNARRPRLRARAPGPSGRSPARESACSARARLLGSAPGASARRPTISGRRAWRRPPRRSEGVCSCPKCWRSAGRRQHARPRHWNHIGTTALASHRRPKSAKPAWRETGSAVAGARYVHRSDIRIAQHYQLPH